MLSKLGRTMYTMNQMKHVTRKPAPQERQVKYSDWLPPTQYDTPFPKKLRLGYVLKHHWEITPVLVVVTFSLSLVCMACTWAIRNKVDVVYSANSRRNISRTMDLRYPTVHKMFTINQKYEPWPEMQDVLDKIVFAEKRALARAQSCALYT